MKQFAYLVGSDSQWPLDGSLNNTLCSAADKLTKGRFIFHGSSTDHVELPFSQALDRALQILARLQSLGCVAGDRIILDSGEPLDFIPALWATLLGGMIAIPMSPSNWTSSATSQFRRRLEFVSSRLNGASVITSRQSAFSGAGRQIHYDFINEPFERAKPAAIEPEHPAILILTSGTTGGSQLVALSRKALAHRWFPHEPLDKGAYLSWMPLEHVMGLRLASPGHPLKIYLPADEFVRNPSAWLQLASKYNVTHAGTTNFGMRLVCSSVDPRAEYDLSALQRVAVGAEPISPDVFRGFSDLLSKFGANSDVVVPGYGLSECGPVTGGLRRSRDNDNQSNQTYLPLGGPSPMHRIRIVSEDAQLAIEGAVGAIEVTGPTATSGYFGDPQANQSLFTADGWIRTGDLGYIANGSLTVVGREKESIILNARKYSMIEIERAIERIASVIEAHIFLVRDQNDDYRPGVAYVANDAVSNVEPLIRQLVADQFGLGILECLAISSAEIPRTATGKLLRSQLSELCSKRMKASLSIPLAVSTVERVSLLLSRFLGNRLPGADDDFFLMGGDSLAALTASIALEKEFNVSIPHVVFTANATPSSIANYIDCQPSSRARVEAISVAAADRSEGNIFFAPGVHGQSGYVSTLSRSGLGAYSIWTLHLRQQSERVERLKTFEELSAECADAILRIQPSGALNLVGHSFGGLVAFETARILRDRGHDVSHLILVDTPSPTLKRQFAAASRRPARYVVQNQRRLAANYIVEPIDVCLSYFRAKDDPMYLPKDYSAGWSYLGAKGVDCYELHGDHHGIVRGEYGAALLNTVHEVVAGRGSPNQVPADQLSSEARSQFRNSLIACRMGILPNEIKALELALSSDPGFPYWAYRRLAAACFSAGRLDRGVSAYRSALERDPWPLGSRAALIATLVASRQFDLVENSLSFADVAKVHCPADAFAKYMIFREVKAWKFAERSLLQGLDVSPHSITLRARLAEVLAGLGRIEEAKREINAAITQPSDNNIALESIGFLAARLGAHGLAEQCFLRSVAIDPEENPRVWVYLRDLAEKRCDWGAVEHCDAWVKKLGSDGGNAKLH